jgi:6-phosphogluconolactonase
LTLTPAAVNAARRVLVLAAGASKRDALRRVLYGPADPLDVPAQRIAPRHGPSMWMMDREAADQPLSD